MGAEPTALTPRKYFTIMTAPILFTLFGAAVIAVIAFAISSASRKARRKASESQSANPGGGS